MNIRLERIQSDKGPFVRVITGQPNTIPDAGDHITLEGIKFEVILRIFDYDTKAITLKIIELE